MRVLFDPRFGEHDPGRGHPDRPDRIAHCLTALAESGAQAEECQYEATTEELSTVHDAGYVMALREACREGGGWLGLDTYAGPRSFTVAARAAGMACTAVDISFALGTSVFSLGRPPGHHSGPSYAMGFCLLNSTAVAASHALQLGAARVMIVDIDVHHGNGTQDIFYDDPRVLYLSVHQSPWYPGTGALTETGEGAGEGMTVNVPLASGSGDATYLAVVDEIARPVATAFAPDVVLVSAGFDAHREDPLGAMDLSTSGFYYLGDRLQALARDVAGGKAVFILEGGYRLEALGTSFLAIAGEAQAPPATEPVPSLSPEGRTAAAFHAKRWGQAPEVRSQRR